MSNPTNSNGSTSNGLPTAYAIIDGKRVPLDYAAARRLALNAHLLSLGDPKRATEMLAEAERAGNNGTNASSFSTVA
jgi:hypothetical protein